MVSLVNQPQGLLNYSKKLNCLEYDLTADFGSSKSIEEYNTTISVANNEDLTQIIESGSIECYISCLSLMIVTNPLNQLSEALRVL